MPYQDKRLRWDWQFLQTLSDDTNCYQLTEKQVNFLLGIEPMYSWATRWQNTEGSSPDDWDTFGSQTMHALMTPSEDCGEECGEGSLGECFRLETMSEAFEFYPNNPFDESDRRFTPTQARWRRLSVIIGEDELPQWLQTTLDFLGDLGGYFPNDCFISYADVAPFQESTFENFFDFLSNFTLQPFPYVFWEMQGIGQFEIEFCQVPLGGAALMSWDITLGIEQIFEIVSGQAGDEGDNWKILELNRDVIGIPPELVPTIVQEIDFTETGEHSVSVLFFPRFDDQLPFIFPFGGIREIEICGLVVTGQETGQSITSYNHRLEQHIRTGAIGIMSVDDICNGVICAFEELSRRMLLASSSENIEGNIEIDKETGLIDFKSILIGGSPVVGTNQELHFGGVYNQAVQFKKLFDDMNANIDSAYAVGTVISLAKLFANPTDISAWEALVTSYFTNDPEIVIDANALALQMFCLGYQNGVLAYALANHGSVEDDVNTIIDFVSDIPSSTWNNWYDVGAKLPRDGYQTASCYRLPDQETEFTAAMMVSGDPALLYLEINQAPNRIKRVVTSGKITGLDGREFDGFYYKHTDGTISYSTATMFRGDSGTLAPASIPPYNPASEYSVEYIITSNSYVASIYFVTLPADTWHDEFNTPTGTIDVTVIDVGKQ